MRWQLVAAILMGTLLCGLVATPRWVWSCPFCNAVSQTLRQEMSSMDAVVIAQASEDIEPSDTGQVLLEVAVVIKGEQVVKKGERVKSVFFGKAKKGERFMLTGVDPPDLLWSSPLPITERSEAYLMKVLKLPESAVDRLTFYQQFLEDSETLLAGDAYDEFAIAPYADVQALKAKMNHDKLVAWIEDPEVAPDRKRLYLTMLGVCGDKKDVPMLESMLKSTKKSTRSGLDALIACYLTLEGADGLKLIERLFLDNPKSEYADTYAAIMALRFHGTETDVIATEQLVGSMHHVLKRPQLADLVIPDLARWKDWSQIDTLVELFKSAEAGNNWVRVPVINYLRTCPLPEAKAAIEELEKVDPAAIRRANTFFPVPGSDQSLDDKSTSQATPVNPSLGNPTADNPNPDNPSALDDPSTPGNLRSNNPSALATADVRQSHRVEMAGATAMVGGVASPMPLAAGGIHEANPFQVLFVSMTIAGSLAISIWLILCAATRPATT